MQVNSTGDTIMLGSRTIKTLIALLISMTVSAFVLMLLETAPVRLPAQQLAAVGSSAEPAGEVIRATAVPLQPLRWRNVVIHGSAAEPGIAERSHFIVDADGEISATDHWRRQLPQRHVYVAGWDFDSDSVGICLVGDFSTQGPSRRQFRSLVKLTAAIQAILRMPAERVYLHSDLDAHSSSPGRAFPAQAFNASL